MKKLPVLAQRRVETRARLAREPFDLLVIGGGITGAGIARDAQMRGVKVALVDKGDFASGTSSRSSKLVHGGLRYLEHGEIKLVLEASRERDLLRRRLAPHLVHPLPFLFPVYRGDRVGMLRLGAALWLYDGLAIFRNVGMHRHLSAERVRLIEPGLRTMQLRGGMLYYDCWTDDARLTLENILSAHAEGAVVCNHMAVRGFGYHSGGRLEKTELEDQFSGERISVSARIVVNATGPWVDRIRELDDPQARPLLRPTKGVHVLVPREKLGNRYAVVLRGVRDQRVMFVIPWQDHALLGTTDTYFDDSPDRVSTDKDDVDYILETVNRYFPSARLTEKDIVGGYAGVRPLIAPISERSASPSSVSREEAIVEASSGLVSVAGGKLTTYRSTAESVTDLVVTSLRKGDPSCSFSPCKTAVTPLPGALGSKDNGVGPPLTASLAPVVLEYLSARYGSRSEELASLLTDPAEREPVIAGLPYLRAEVPHAAVREFAVTLEDVFRRRTQIAFRARDAGLSKASEVIDILAGLYGWGQEEKAAELRRYRRSLGVEQAFKDFPGG